MTDENKQELRFSLSLSTRPSDEESRSFWNRSVSLPDQPVESQRICAALLKRTAASTAYTPPDSLMFPLLSAIQQKAWGRAKRLCREVVACDPDRRVYRELYTRLDRIIILADQRARPRTIARSTTAATIATITAETAVEATTPEP